MTCLECSFAFNCILFNAAAIHGRSRYWKDKVKLVDLHASFPGYPDNTKLRCFDIKVNTIVLQSNSVAVFRSYWIF